MSKAKELIEMANELVSSRDPACTHIWNAHRQCQWCHRERVDVYADMIARHILATVQDDDDEPAERVWLEKIGLELDEAMGAHVVFSQPKLVDGNSGYRGIAVYDIDHEKASHRQLYVVDGDFEQEAFTGICGPTRGEIRRFCSLLKIELKN